MSEYHVITFDCCGLTYFSSILILKIVPHRRRASVGTPCLRADLEMILLEISCQ